MLAKRIVCNISGSFVSIAMSGKMKSNPGSLQVASWTYLEAGRPAPSPHRPGNFCSEYILWRRRHWTATVAEQCPDNATAALSSCSSVKFPNVYRQLSADHRNADRNYVRVWAHLR